MHINQVKPTVQIKRKEKTEMAMGQGTAYILLLFLPVGNPRNKWSVPRWPVWRQPVCSRFSAAQLSQSTSHLLGEIRVAFKNLKLPHIILGCLFPLPKSDYTREVTPILKTGKGLKRNIWRKASSCLLKAAQLAQHQTSCPFFKDIVCSYFSSPTPVRLSLEKSSFKETV